MTMLPKFRVKQGTPVGIDLFFQLPDLSTYPKTYFDADEAAGQTTLSANGSAVSTGYLLLGIPGTPKAEIVLASAVAATTITTGATVYAHSRGEPITFIPYNQIEPSRSTDAGVNYTPLTEIDIRADVTETYLNRPSDAATDYYKFRFKNSTDTAYSDYSDVVIATGFADNSVHSIKQRALRTLGEELGGKITDEFLNEALNELRREVDQDDRVFRWSFRTKFNTDIGDCIPGRYSVAAPSDLRDENTNKNILSLRIGRDSVPLDYQDTNRFNQNYLGVAHSTLNGAITSASTSIVLASSGDFDESGSVDIAAEDVAGTIDNALYTTNTELTATLGTVTSIADSHASGRDVWQGIGFGQPGNFTVDDGTIKFDLPFHDDLAGENIVMDYYQELQAVNSDADLLDEPVYDMYVPGLRYKIKYLKSNGTLKTYEDDDWKEYRRGVERLVNQEISGQTIQLIPD